MRVHHSLQYHMSFTACPTLAPMVALEPCCIDNKQGASQCTKCVGVTSLLSKFGVNRMGGPIKVCPVRSRALKCPVWCGVSMGMQPHGHQLSGVPIGHQPGALPAQVVYQLLRHHKLIWLDSQAANCLQPGEVHSFIRLHALAAASSQHLLLGRLHRVLSARACVVAGSSSWSVCLTSLTLGRLLVGWLTLCLPLPPAAHLDLSGAWVGAAILLIISNGVP